MAEDKTTQSETLPAGNRRVTLDVGKNWEYCYSDGDHSVRLEIEGFRREISNLKDRLGEVRYKNEDLIKKLDEARCGAMNIRNDMGAEIIRLERILKERGEDDTRI